MTLKENVQTVINEQINHELHSAYLYLSMASYFESIALPGFAHWMRNQAEEEKFHAMKFFDYVVERGGRVTLTTIDAPQTEWKSPLEVFKAALAHEQKVTALIYNIADVAIAEKDHGTKVMLDWFITEQVEEEASAQEIVDKLSMLEGSKQGLFLLDKELGARPPATPPPAE